MTKEEISSIVKRCGTEIECFIHGALEAIDDQGRSMRLATPTGQPELRLLSNHPSCQRAGQLRYIDIVLCDRNGGRYFFADRKITVCVSGGKLLALGTASPTSLESFDSDTVTLYEGRAQAIVQCTGQDMEICVLSEGVQDARLLLPME